MTWPLVEVNRRLFTVDQAGTAVVSYAPRTHRVVVHLTTIEGCEPDPGDPFRSRTRMVTRAASFNLPVASYIDRLSLATDAGVLLSLPFHTDYGPDPDDDDEDEDERCIRAG